MPSLSVYFIRTAFIYLILGFSIGTLLLWQKATFISAEIWKFLPMHLELLTFGFLIQFIMGVAFWILPKYSSNPRRGNENLVWIAFILLNLGILIVSFQSTFSNSLLAALVGRVSEFLAFIIFAASMWMRVKPFSGLEH